MHKLIDSQKRATEAFYQNPDVRSFGYFSPSNFSPYVAAANQNQTKPETNAQTKEMTSSVARSTANVAAAVPFGILSQMARSQDVTSPNHLLQNNLGLIRNENMPHAILENRDSCS